MVLKVPVVRVHAAGQVVVAVHLQASLAVQVVNLAKKLWQFKVVQSSGSASDKPVLGADFMAC